MAAVGMMMGTRARTEAEVTRLDRLDNAALAALAQPRPNVSSKYNFYVQLGKCSTVHASSNTIITVFYTVFWIRIR